MIRAAIAADLPAIQTIYSHHVLHGTATFELDPPPLAEIATRHAALVGKDFPYLVADLDGDVVGYGYAGPYRPRPAYRFTVEDSIYLRADRCGRGWGRLLLARLIAESEARSFRQMVAVIGGGGENAASVRAHAALGFREVGTLRGVGFKFGRWLDTTVMQRTLGPHDPSLLPANPGLS